MTKFGGEISMEILITNNPKFKNSSMAVRYLDESLLAVLKQVRDLIHQGYYLVTHPLTGNITAAQTPYKTVLLMKGTNVCFNDLQIIEKAIAAAQSARQRAKPSENRYWDQDLQNLDFSLIQPVINKSQGGLSDE